MVRLSLDWQPSANLTNTTGSLSLPRELRDMVYGYALPIPDGDMVLEARGPCRSWPSHTRNKTKLRLSVVLFRICRQIRAETAPMLYHRNFELGAKYIANLPPHPGHFPHPFRYCGYLIKHVSFGVLQGCSGRSPANHSIWRVILKWCHGLLATLVNLERIDVQVCCHGPSSTHIWDELLPAKPSETREQHTKRILNWMQTMYKLDLVKVPKALRVSFKHCDPVLNSSVLDWDIDAFNDAIQRFGRRTR